MTIKSLQMIDNADKVIDGIVDVLVVPDVAWYAWRAIVRSSSLHEQIHDVIHKVAVHNIHGKNSR